MKKHYRVTVFPKASSLSKEIALLACMQNGLEEKTLTFPDLAGHFKTQCTIYPSTTNADETTLTIVESKLLIDRKVGEETRCELEIEEIEIVGTVPAE